MGVDVCGSDCILEWLYIGMTVYGSVCIWE